MMMVSTFTNVSRTAEVNIKYKLSGVVINKSGGRRASCCLSRAEVSPVRMPTTGAL
ncbi:unannotated protein [freshwater metagenome]|uniref:Unannotated protein n=1 Tax=freshwater metagenome TaxID=449393 RepID=A0A6J6ECN8_9ZZZZ